MPRNDANFGIGTLAPDFLGDLGDQPQLSPLLILSENIAFLGRAEAAAVEAARAIAARTACLITPLPFRGTNATGRTPRPDGRLSNTRFEWRARQRLSTHNSASVPIPKFARACSTTDANFGIEGH